MVVWHMYSILGPFGVMKGNQHFFAIKQPLTVRKCRVIEGRGCRIGVRGKLPKP